MLLLSVILWTGGVEARPGVLQCGGTRVIALMRLCAGQGGSSQATNSRDSCGVGPAINSGVAGQVFLWSAAAQTGGGVVVSISRRSGWRWLSELVGQLWLCHSGCVGGEHGRGSRACAACTEVHIVLLLLGLLSTAPRGEWRVPHLTWSDRVRTVQLRPQLRLSRVAVGWCGTVKRGTAVLHVRESTAVGGGATGGDHQEVTVKSRLLGQMRRMTIKRASMWIEWKIVILIVVSILVLQSKHG